jgi:hypothetical protein
MELKALNYLLVTVFSISELAERETLRRFAESYLTL